MKKIIFRRLRGIAAALLALAALCCACGSKPPEQPAPPTSAPDPPIQSYTIDILLPQASGTVVYEKNGVSLDASNADQGYVMVRADDMGARLKLRITLGEVTYTYDLEGGADYVPFPLQSGSGDYQVRVLRHAYDSLYEPVFEETVTAGLADPFSPFLLPNQYVNYNEKSNAVRRSYELAAGHSEPGKKAEAIYRYVADNIEYDYDMAAEVEAGTITSYLPDVDRTLAQGKGICFDYSSLLAAMLRAQGIPAQLVMGPVEPEGIFHAWNMVYYDGRWRRMDATYDDVPHKDQDYTAQKFY